ncbi:563_t:CDS:1 [Paraglomus brasilianum]|uniref:563_t:CDS:1 n=1 Tax=Paraglomus brasilianum TaxID=144538 RepID=A0A9N9BAC2_9GLOM|nr:563_t:CDS:1 [Paraglomus brasilianum]
MQDYESNTNIQLKLCELVEDVRRRFPKMQTTLSIQQLIAPSTCSRSKAIPRPQNCFMIFRKDVTAMLTKEQKIRDGQETVRLSSKMASDEWKKIKNDKKNYPDEDRDLDFWKLLSEIADCQHKIMFPEYKYSPNQKEKRKRRKKINHAVSDNFVPQPLLLQSSENVYLNNIYDEGNIDTNNVAITQSDIIDVPIYDLDYGLFSLFDDLQTADFCDDYSYYSHTL